MLSSLHSLKVTLVVPSPQKRTCRIPDFDLARRAFDDVLRRSDAQIIFLTFCTSGEHTDWYVVDAEEAAA